MKLRPIDIAAQLADRLVARTQELADAYVKYMDCRYSFDGATLEEQEVGARDLLSAMGRYSIIHMGAVSAVTGEILASEGLAAGIDEYGDGGLDF